MRLKEDFETPENDENPHFQNEGYATPLKNIDMGISDTVMEHEEDMDALMRRIKGKCSNLQDPFHMVDKTVKYPIYDEARD